MADTSGETAKAAQSSALAPFNGEFPPAPAWFREALADVPDRAMVETPRGRIEALSWGERGKPGLLFVHGNTAHADWWSFICPLFAGQYRVTAMSLAGMGGSDWREVYSFDDFAEDAEAAAASTGLHEGGRKPVYIGHSFGGGQVFYTASQRPEQMHAAILIDVGFRSPVDETTPPPPARPQGVRERRPARVYPSLAAALARFRLSPPQPAENLFIVDHLARHGLMRAPMADGSGEGWAWKFDPQTMDRLDREAVRRIFSAPPRIDMPLAHLIGEHSMLRTVPGLYDAYPRNGLVIEIPDAHHHVMVDRPLALIAAIRSLLAAWRA
ncbi:alpha/beta hydrolase [Phenylobacterium sp. LjRoot225]|uniref:alpha/beta fold hydrolase n=1 Tax=Phenylobacterium sp. LjRoot225 TaxID=3342285 RepID=UPI003ED0DA08